MLQSTENPKHQARNPKQIQITEAPMIETLSPARPCFEFSALLVRICFGFRYSDLAPCRVTACLLSDKLRGLGQLGSLVEMMVKIVGEDPMGDWRLDTDDGGERITQRVFVLTDRMCSVAAAINSVDPFGRELLILHHVERLAVAVLADAHGVSVDDIRRALAEAERQFTELLQGLSGWEDGTEPDVGMLLVELADCIDLPWAEALGAFALGYAAEWKEGPFH
jgi:hypothetical protein